MQRHQAAKPPVGPLEKVGGSSESSAAFLLLEHRRTGFLFDPYNLFRVRSRGDCLPGALQAGRVLYGLAHNPGEWCWP